MQAPFFKALMYWPETQPQVFALVFAVNVLLHAEQTPVPKEHVAQLSGQAKQVLFPVLKVPAGQVMILTHVLLAALNHWTRGSGLQAHELSVCV